MSSQLTLPGITAAISSPGSAAGNTPSSSPAGPKTARSGREAVLASHSPSLGNGGGQLTLVISGRCGSGSSASADLQFALASRLAAAADVHGSPEYSLTWKRWAMPSREPICRLRASARRISANGCSGWPTASARDWKGCQSNQHGKNARPLNEIAYLAGWPTPNTLTGGQTSRGSDRQDELLLGGLARGMELSSPPSATGKRGGLNPEFVCWLLGFPAGWGASAPTAMPSSRSVRRSS